jgi:hypothetical protein
MTTAAASRNQAIHIAPDTPDCLQTAHGKLTEHPEPDPPRSQAAVAKS